MQPQSERQLKVSESLKRVISEALNISRIFEHVIGSAYVSVSEVNISPDLKNAKIFVIPNCKEEDRKEVISLMNEYSYEIKKIIARELKLKFTPRLYFVYDEIFNEAHKIEEIINRLDIPKDDEDESE
jgi:ribosome-binding factor A